jgi:hypothetical protein
LTISTTVTVDAGITAFVEIGTLVVAVGSGGFFIINGQKFPIVEGVQAALVGGAEADGGVVAIFEAEEVAGTGGAIAAQEEEEEDDEELDEDEEVRVKSLIPQTSAKFSKVRARDNNFINHLIVHLIVHFVVHFIFLHINSILLPDFSKGWQQFGGECKFRKKASRT